MSLAEETAVLLQQAVEAVHVARRKLAASHDGIGEAHSLLAEAAAGTRTELGQAVLALGDIASCLTAQVELVERAEQTLRAYLGRLGVGPQATGHPVPVRQATMPPRQTVSGRDGSRYSSAAAWCADLLPPRVRKGEGQRTVGYLSGTPSPFISGLDGTWSPAAEERLRLADVPARTARFLRSHVELKAIMAMIQVRATHAELVINNVPCGSQAGDLPGCHDVLERVLPPGATMVVHGTTHQGDPYTHTYKGRRDR